MARRSRNVGVRSDQSGSTRDWLVGGVAWEIETALTAVPLMIVVGLLTLVSDVSFTGAMVIAVVAFLTVRLVAGGWRRLTASGSDRSRTPREGL